MLVGTMTQVIVIFRLFAWHQPCLLHYLHPVTREILKNTGKTMFLRPKPPRVPTTKEKFTLGLSPSYSTGPVPF